MHNIIYVCTYTVIYIFVIFRLTKYNFIAIDKDFESIQKKTLRYGGWTVTSHNVNTTYLNDFI